MFRLNIDYNQLSPRRRGGHAPMRERPLCGSLVQAQQLVPAHHHKFKKLEKSGWYALGESNPSLDRERVPS